MGGSRKISGSRIGSPTLLAALLGVGLFGSSLTASAAVTTTWDLTNGSLCQQTVGTGTACIGDGSPSATNGNVYQFTQAYGAAGKLTATAYYNSTTSTPVTNLGSASFLGQYTPTGYGLGVENKTAPQHAMDNYNGFDFIVFTLPGPATSVTISLSTFLTYENVNATVFYGNGALPASLTSLPSNWVNANVPQNPFKETATCDSTYQGSGYGGGGSACGEYNGYYAVTGNGTYSSNGSPAPQITVNDTTGTFTEVILAVNLTPGTDQWGDKEYDYFKVSSLSYTAGSSRVPEPTSMAILAASLVGLGFLRRRRRHSA